MVKDREIYFRGAFGLPESLNPYNMWITILDYREAEVLAVEVTDIVKEFDNYVHDLIGHSDYYYMTNESLVVKINELDNPNQQIITKLKQ